MDPLVLHRKTICSVLEGGLSCARPAQPTFWEKFFKAGLHVPPDTTKLFLAIAGGHAVSLSGPPAGSGLPSAQLTTQDTQG